PASTRRRNSWPPNAAPRRWATPSPSTACACCWPSAPWCWAPWPPTWCCTCPPSRSSSGASRRRPPSPPPWSRAWCSSPSGHWSDRHGRTGIMATAAVLFLVLIYPLFQLLAGSPTFGTMILVQIIIGVLLAGYFGALPALLNDLFPTQTRTTGMSLAYNIAVTIFGGFAPFIIVWLISVSGNKLAPSF